MNQYNAELNRIQQAYNSEMQNPQNNLSQYRQQQFLPPVQPSQQQEQGTKCNWSAEWIFLHQTTAENIHDEYEKREEQ